MQTEDASACGDPNFERSVLTPEALANWDSCPIAWIEASPHTVRADLTTERTGLVMIDSGATQADFSYGAKRMSWEFMPNSIGLFTAGTELKGSRWSWTLTRRIHLDLQAIRPDFLETFGHLPRHTELEFRDPELSLVLRAMAHEAAAGNPNGRLFADSLTLGVVMRLHDRRMNLLAAPRERGKLSAAQVRAVDALVESRLHANIALAEMACATGFSPAQFVRLFKNTTGHTPHQYLLAARVKRAKALVLAGELPFYRIAELTGFSHQSHMNAAFVRAFNTPPGELRRRAGLTRPRASPDLPRHER